MVIHGIENLTRTDVDRELSAGARFVAYEYCLSGIVASSRRPSDIYFLPAHDWGILRGVPYSLVSFLFGWWGIPWGFIYTPLTIFNNLSGGCDVTEEVLAYLEAEAYRYSEEDTRTPTWDDS